MHTHIHNCCVSAIVVDMEVPTAEAARMLDVSQQRIRALIASGILDARQVAGRWLVDADSIDRQAAIATGSRGGRGLAQHVAWAAADLLDRGLAPWLTPKDRWRLRARLLHELDGVDTARRWLRNRYTQASTWRAGPTAIERLLTTDGVLATGVSAAGPLGLELGTAGSADVYVQAERLDQLVHDHFLIESATGNLTVRTTEQDYSHRTGKRSLEGIQVAPRLLVAADLADDNGARTRKAGHDLFADVLLARTVR